MNSGKSSESQNINKFPQVIVGGIATVSCTGTELANQMVHDCLESRKHPGETAPKLVFCTNGQGIALAGRSVSHMQDMSNADYVYADGMSVVFASRKTQFPLPERISTTDFFHDASIVAEQNDLRYYLLGSSEEQNSAAVAQINKQYPGVSIVGRFTGKVGVDFDEAICAEIRECKPDVLWVALGKPLQEQWCVRNQDRLHGVGWVIPCGGLYAFLAGDVPRAPSWMQQIGIEWLFRLAGDPKRLFWRYFWTNPYSFWRLFRHTR